MPLSLPRRRFLLRGSFWLERLWSNDFKHELPPLTIVRDPNISNSYERGSLKVLAGWLDEDVFRHLQQTSGIHLSPSSTEGFSQAMHEAMSAASIVVTLDAPPMNEFVLDTDCLVPLKNLWKPTAFQYLATLYDYDVRDLVKIVKELTALPQDQLIEKGLKNREFYLKNRENFRKRLKELF